MCDDLLMIVIWVKAGGGLLSEVGKYFLVEKDQVDLKA